MSLGGGKPTNAALLLFGSAPQRFHRTAETKCVSVPAKPLDVYQERSPQYQHFNLHGKDIPSHAELVASRDRMVAKHPRTTFVSCHLGNQGHDLGTLGKALDRYATNLLAIAGFFALATFAYAAFSTMALVLPSDLFKSTSVASVSGISGTAAGAVTILATYLIGDITTRYSFTPVLIAGSIIPLIGAVLVLWLIRNPRTAAEQRILQRI